VGRAALLGRGGYRKITGQAAYSS